MARYLVTRLYWTEIEATNSDEAEEVGRDLPLSEFEVRDVIVEELDPPHFSIHEAWGTT